MEVIEVTEREVEIIEVIERGPQGLTGPTGPQGPQGPAGAAGAGLTTLTTAGDLLYRNNSEATRLPIGSNGQVLKVSGGLPAWANESGAVTSVNGATGAVTVAAAQHATEHEAGEADEIQAMAAIVTTDDASLNGIYVPNASGTTSGGRLTLYKTGTRQNTKLEYNQSLSIWQLIKNAVVQLSGQEINATYAWTTQQWLDERSPQVLPNGGTVTRAGLEVLARRAADGTSNVATATTSEDGLLSSADKTKLNGIAANATANSSDATLLARANHTGTQAHTTITGLGTLATANAATPPNLGTTTPADATFTNLTANTRLNLPNANGTTAGDLYRNANTLRYRDGTNTERLLLNASDNLANLASAATSRTNLGVGSSDAVTFGSLQNTPIGSTTASSVAATTLSASGTVSGTGFSSYLASPPAIGGTSAAAGSFTTLSASTSLTLGTSGILSGGTNTIEQRNTTSAQTFRIYNTVSGAADANYERGFISWVSNTLRIGTERLGTGSARALEFQTDGTTRASVTTGGNFWVNNQLILGTTVLARITSPADGVVTLFDSGQATFNRLQFGGTTSSFPALKRSSTALQVRLADDSAFAPLEALSFTTANSRIVCDDTNTVIHVGNTPRISLFGSNATYLGLGNAHDIRWSNTGRSDQAASFNISLARDADGILAQRAGTTAQTWRIYNTVSGTGNVNFERANFRWATNEFIIDAEAGGTGTSLRGIKIGSATSSLLGFYGVTPVDQPATVADPAGGGTVDTEARTAINAIIDRLQELGLIA